MALGRIVPAVLRVLPILPPAAFFLSAIVRDVGFGGVVAMLFLSGISFLLLLTLVVLVRIRRRSEGGTEPGGVDLAWIGGAAVAWIVTACLPSPWQAVAAIAALVVSALAVRWAFRALRSSVAAASGGANPTPGASRRSSPKAPASGPDAGKVIILNPTTPSSDDGQTPTDATGGPFTHGRAPYDGPMPGSTRTGDGPARSDSTRPGANFGANRAPVSPTWDATRPVPDSDAVAVDDADGVDAERIGAGDADDVDRELGYGALADDDTDDADDRRGRDRPER